MNCICKYIINRWISGNYLFYP